MKHITKLAAATALALCLPLETSAQSTPCGSRAVVGAAAWWLKPDIPVDPEPAGGGRHGLARAGKGLEGFLHASFPITSAWSVLAEFSAPSMGLGVFVACPGRRAYCCVEVGVGSFGSVSHQNCLGSGRCCGQIMLSVSASYSSPFFIT
jgi:hypothetical protein